MLAWKWLGHKQHFYGASDCAFSLATQLPTGYVVSTVGEYLLNDAENYSPMYYKYIYETIVFKVHTDKEPFDCGCPTISYTGVFRVGSNTCKEATQNHMDTCIRYSQQGVINE